MRRHPRPLDRCPPPSLDDRRGAAPVAPHSFQPWLLSMAIASGIFRQYDVRGIVGQDLTAEVGRALGAAYAALLRERGISGEVAVGRDNRASGDMLRDALVEGLTGAGVDVVDVGIVPTPLLYWSLHHLPVVGGIQITGSHNPAEYNGFKLCLGKESLHGPDIQHLLLLIRRGATMADRR